MTEHEFTIILADDPDEAQADRLYAIVDDGTIATESGVAMMHFHRKATTLMDAMQSALRDIQKSGAKPLRIDLRPEQVLPPAEQLA